MTYSFAAILAPRLLRRTPYRVDWKERRADR